MTRLPEDLERLLHDLRGPLNALAMHAEVLKRAVGEDPASATSVRTIQQEAERLADLLGAAMRVVALERSETRQVSLRAILDEAMAEPALKSVVVHEGPWPEVVCDPPLLVHAVRELLRNAVEATAVAGPDTPAPEVSVEPGDGTVAVVVRDYGAGLRSTNPKIVIRLRTTTKPGHQGVGLVSAERVARLHGGTLTFEAPGRGARVRLLVPLGDRQTPRP